MSDISTDDNTRAVESEQPCPAVVAKLFESSNIGYLWEEGLRRYTVNNTNRFVNHSIINYVFDVWGWLLGTYIPYIYYKGSF